MSRLQAAVFQVLEGFTLSDDVRKILEAAYYAQPEVVWTEPVSLGSVNRDYDQGFADGCSESKRLNEHLVAASAQGRAAGLEEAAKICDEKAAKVNSRWIPQECAEAIRALSPTSSDAGKDDARDAARWRVCLDLAHGHSDGEVDDLRVQVPYPSNRHLYKSTADQFIAAIDAALSSLEVIGKGEKG